MSTLNLLAHGAAPPAPVADVADPAVARPVGPDLVSLHDLSDAELHAIVTRAAGYAAGAPAEPTLRGRIVGIWFAKTSTRTRTAFSTAALRLGADIVTFGPDDLQLKTGETIEDTGAVLSRMLDAVVARTAGPDEELRALGGRPAFSVINAMTAGEHPTQAITDLATIERHRGQVDGVRLLYVGEGNNTAVALARGLTRYPGTHLELRTPAGYGLPAGVTAECEAIAAAHGSRFVELHDMDDVALDADIVYTTRWQTTGTSKPDPDWRERFVPFRLTQSLVEANPGCIVMHDLPAHRGEDIAAEVLDGPDCIAFDQASAKQSGAMAVLEWCLAGSDR